ncbi:hypothetical protein RHMOL_Rhmol07G0155900 [Rhododendron molle]|uniref:Uncharacterized protein n=1 Tax=Rhododendron molle TaxID=49168 RepID=A0ACC0N300_RHOML|nr:hypothetical protein RHMOL_Rhmol07G0155900 [Rhododendron molle]
MWSIWTSRNIVIFNNKPWEKAEVVDLIKTRLALWIKGKYNIKDYSVEDFKRSVDGIRKICI